MRKGLFIDRYLVDREYRITVYKDRVYIVNYLEIVDFSDTRIVIRYDGGVSTLEGVHLVIAKMLDDELLIEGCVSRVLV